MTQALSTLNDNNDLSEVVTDSIPQSSLTPLLAPLRDGSDMLIQQQILMNQVLDPERREIIMDLFNRPPVDFKSIAGRDFQVFGMAIWEQPGGWKGKDGQFHPEGYYQIRILILDDTRKEESFVVVKSSGTGLAQHVLHILNNRGWFLFDEPITYHFEVTSDNAHRIFNTSHDKRIKELLKARAK